MEKTFFNSGGIEYPVIALDIAVIGSGCAGFNAADWLHTFGRRDIAVITEGINCGTSRNTGSDKQTYYKLTLSGEAGDSIGAMAADLFAGGGVDGDTALAEAAGSVRSFIKLCNLGVPFPTDAYGQYAGYKTDHDPRSRATSAGPLTSRLMTEALERAVLDKGIPVLDRMTAVKLLISDDGVEGLICLDHTRLDTPARGITVIRARNVILATGGPAACYLHSAYPGSQSGMSGMALEAGANAANLHEWQYGLASLKFRWNVSGTYQQVLPRFISVDDAGYEREFLLEHYQDAYRAMDMVFLKGYQWPFDTAKLDGSSLVDVLVHRETAVLGRRVYMDFRRNPSGLESGFGGLGDETRRYLELSSALFGTPIERLEKMNRPAIDLYMNNGINLYEEPLEIGVCAQHHNGGIEVDADWQSSVRGLYAAGEAAGTFGVSRPGGSALNSTQVGSLRAAEHIAGNTPPDTGVPDAFIEIAAAEAEQLCTQLGQVLLNGKETPTAAQRMREHGEKMSRYAGHLRDITAMKAFRAELENALEGYFGSTRAESVSALPALMKARDTMITQTAVLSAMIRSAETVGSHGSALVEGADGVHTGGTDERLITKRRGGFVSETRAVRPMPKPDGWFENVWNDYRKRTEGIADD